MPFSSKSSQRWLQIAAQILERDGWLLGPFTEGSKVLGVFAQRSPDRSVHQLRDTPVGLGGLDTESPMEALVEINGGTLGS